MVRKFFKEKNFYIFYIYAHQYLLDPGVGIGACGEQNKANEFVGAMVSIIQCVLLIGVDQFSNFKLQNLERSTIWRIC